MKSLVSWRVIVPSKSVKKITFGFLSRVCGKGILRSLFKQVSMILIAVVLSTYVPEKEDVERNRKCLCRCKLGYGRYHNRLRKKLTVNHTWRGTHRRSLPASSLSTQRKHF